MAPDTDPRQALLAKRRELQSRAQRQRQRDYLATELAALEAAGTPYQIVWPEALAGHWPGERLPRAASGDTLCAGPCDAAQRDRCVRDALAARAADPHRPLLVVWGNAERPSLRMAAADVAAHCTLLLDADWETWIGPAEADWLLACERDGAVRVVALPPAANPPTGR